MNKIYLGLYFGGFILGELEGADFHTANESKNEYSFDSFITPVVFWEAKEIRTTRWMSRINQ